VAGMKKPNDYAKKPSLVYEKITQC